MWGIRAWAEAGGVDAVSVRKNHKADREKLRRDRLNDILTELAILLGEWLGCHPRHLA